MRLSGDIAAGGSKPAGAPDGFNCTAIPNSFAFSALEQAISCPASVDHVQRIHQIVLLYQKPCWAKLLSPVDGAGIKEKESPAGSCEQEI